MIESLDSLPPRGAAEARALLDATKDYHAAVIQFGAGHPLTETPRIKVKIAAAAFEATKADKQITDSLDDSMLAMGFGRIE